MRRPARATVALVTALVSAPVLAVPLRVTAQTASAASAAQPRADSAALALLERAAKAYQGARTLRAAFTQSLTNPRTRTDLRSSGEFFQRGADRFAFRFTAPAEDRIVSDGQVLWLYAPSTTRGQVLKLPRGAGIGMDLASGVLREPAKRYTVTSLGDTTLDGRPVRAVRLVPKAAGAPFTRATLWLDSQSALVRRAEFIEASGLVRTLAFTDIRVGTALPRDAFVFVVPEGVRVIDQAAMLGGTVPR